MRSPLNYPSYRIPTCSKCEGKCVRNDKREWYCPSCADDFLRGFLEGKAGRKSIGGVELPAGVSDERKRDFTLRHLTPNRAARRAAR